MSDRVTFSKIVILGDGGVGKTSIRKRYFGEKFETNYMATIGADFAAKEVEFKGSKHLLQFWDLAGQLPFAQVRKTYYKNSDAIILVYDLSRHETFKDLPNWLNEFSEVNAKALSEVPMILIGNKLDVRKSPYFNPVTHEEGLAYAKKLSEWRGKEINYFETSALININIESAITNLIEQI